jgi:hypothetical protein
MKRRLEINIENVMCYILPDSNMKIIIVTQGSSLDYFHL